FCDLVSSAPRTGLRWLHTICSSCHIPKRHGKRSSHIGTKAVIRIIVITALGNRYGLRCPGSFSSRSLCSKADTFPPFHFLKIDPLFFRLQEGFPKCHACFIIYGFLAFRTF